MVSIFVNVIDITFGKENGLNLLLSQVFFSFLGGGGLLFRRSSRRKDYESFLQLLKYDGRT